MTQLTARFRVPYPGFELNAEMTVPAKGVTVIFGRSGSGKTTLLRCMAGLNRAQEGFFQIGDEVWQDESKSLFLPVHERALGLVFQDARLFPHLNVRANLNYGYRRIPEHERRIGFDRIVDLFELAPLLERMPGNLSGGEQQRVAIARSLINDPGIIFADEPTGNLDRKTGDEVMSLLLSLVEETKKTLIVVTHDPAVAQKGDRVLMLEDGRLA